MNMEAKSSSVYDIVTEQILNELASGVIPWEKPWICGTCKPCNWVSRDEYRGINRFLLPREGEYMTINQANQHGGRVREGAKSHIVTFFKTFEKKKKSATGEDDETEDATSRKDSFIVLRYYRVFHISDIEGIESKVPVEAENARYYAPEDEAEAIISAYLMRTGVTLKTALGDKAEYNEDTDTVTIPLMKQFKSVESYYATLFHELIHSTGHAERFNREVGLAACDAFDFTKEQLIAEMGSAMLMSHCGLDSAKVYRDAAARIDGWTKTLSSNKRLVVWAASAAEKAVKFILGETSPAV